MRNKIILWSVASFALATLIVGTGILSYFIGYNRMLNRPYTVVRSDVNFIYVNYATLPILHSSLHFLSHDTPSYVFFGRDNTYYVNKMPDHVQLFSPGDANIAVTPTVIAERTRQLVADIEEVNPGSTYHFFVDDFMTLLPFYALLRNNIPLERAHITLITNGTATYHHFFTMVDFTGTQEKLEDWLEIFKGTAQVTPSVLTDTRNLSLAAAMMPNVEWWMQFPEFMFLHPHATPAVRQMLMQASLVKVQPQDLLHRLTPEMRDLFFNATIGHPTFQIGDQPLRTALDGYFNNQEKPIMIISGTNPNSPTLATTILDQIIEEFSDDYILMWKPHPAYTATDAAMQARGITVLPARLPMEVLMWAYPDLYIGGYQSSLYLATAIGQTRFTIGGFTLEILEFLDDNNWFNISHTF
ncbi:MAG: hypothetical protein FWE31_01670 [Firmicutes bacterium]|nr:hypothetical protein [Bacillota bacterium]